MEDTKHIREALTLYYNEKESKVVNPTYASQQAIAEELNVTLQEVKNQIRYVPHKKITKERQMTEEQEQNIRAHIKLNNGDTHYAIAEKFGVTENQVRTLSNPKRKKANIGKKCQKPSKPMIVLEDGTRILKRVKRNLSDEVILFIMGKKDKDTSAQKICDEVKSLYDKDITTTIVYNIWKGKTYSHVTNH